MKPPKTLRAHALDILSRQEVSRVGLKRKPGSPRGKRRRMERFWTNSPNEIGNPTNVTQKPIFTAKATVTARYVSSKPWRNKVSMQTTAREFLPDREDELQTAISVLHKKFKQEAQDLKEKQKQARFLAYRGFGADTIQTALKTAWNEEDSYQ